MHLTLDLDWGWADIRSITVEIRRERASIRSHPGTQSPLVGAVTIASHGVIVLLCKYNPMNVVHYYPMRMRKG